MSIVCLFPGQGSQSVGMGGDLFERYADWTAEADRILGYSIRELCLEDPRGELGLTQFTQPALFVVNALTWRARVDEGKPAPAYVAGHSLGEYNALLAAGVFDFATGLELVRERGALMGRVSGGGMAAVIGLTPERIAGILEGSEAGRRIDVANYNAFDQTVIAGPQADLEAVRPDFEAAGARAFTTLKVSAPFHSRYMREAMEEFAATLERYTFAAPAIPVISNVTAEPYPAGDVRGTLAKQIGSSVRWLDSMIWLLDRGITEFEEVGPGNVLTKMIARIRKARK
ncbi:MAG: ACP S-malonyltransferase [Acidobacteriota bacterium]|jgi:malonyl CoA-acyl carrier protein transacylase|nr:MAG: [acyl-carrier-protein] S-malonyltransferase [Acidobacteriota bacterium]